MIRLPVLTRLSAVTALVIVGATAAGVIGLAIGEAVPDRWIADELHEAVIDGTLTATAQATTRHGNISDHFTECIGLSIGLGETSGAGFLETIAENPHLGPCDRLVPAIEAYGGSGSLPTGGSYLRYWHGYTAFTRPATALVGVSGLRMLGFLALVASVGGLGVAVHRNSGVAAAFALLTPIVATSDLLELSDSATQSFALAVGFAGAHLVFVIAKRDLSITHVWFASLLGGIAFVYVDILTVVPGMWILPAALVALVARSTGSQPHQIAGWSIVSGLGWIIGYLGMWLGKWIFSSLILGSSRVIDEVSETINERLSGDSTLVHDGFLRANRRNFGFWFDRPLTALTIIISLMIIAVVVAARIRRRQWLSLARFAVAASPAAVPIIWFEIADNHSQIHHWFTYRSLPLALGVVLLAAVTPESPSVGAPVT